MSNNIHLPITSSDMNHHSFGPSNSNIIHEDSTIITIADMKRELKDYIQQVIQIENENKSHLATIQQLHEHINELTNELSNQKVEMHERLNNAKEIWKNQALEFGKQQKEIAYEECDEAVEQFKSFFLNTGDKNVFLSVKDTSVPIETLAMLLVKRMINEEIYKHENELLKAMLDSSIKMSSPNLLVRDFDVKDCHVSIVNQSQRLIDLENYYLRFKFNGNSFRFPESTLLKSNERISIWWGDRNKFREYGNNNSFYWKSRLPFYVHAKDQIELIEKQNDNILYSLHSNQWELEVDCDPEIPPSSMKDKSKRKRQSISSSSVKKSKVSIPSVSFNLPSESGDSNNTILSNVCSLNTPIRWENIFLSSFPRPILRQRFCGPITISCEQLFLRHPISKELLSSEVCIRVINSCDKCFNMSFWRFTTIGYPSFSFEIPHNIELQANESLLFSSRALTDYAKYDDATTVVIPEIKKMIEFSHYPCSLHLIDELGQNICEFVESSDSQTGVFGNLPSVYLDMSIDENNTPQNADVKEQSIFSNIHNIIMEPLKSITNRWNK